MYKTNQTTMNIVSTDNTGGRNLTRYFLGCCGHHRLALHVINRLSYTVKLLLPLKMPDYLGVHIIIW